mmetsp:Transcript_23748/g.72596  ORF Transcript_23748/g.72596 Transcript_23748/m.72596 type:complete len:106 (-) Transcript_23748:2639-2956(-)
MVTEQSKWANTGQLDARLVDSAEPGLAAARHIAAAVCVVVKLAAAGVAAASHEDIGPADTGPAGIGPAGIGALGSADSEFEDARTGTDARRAYVGRVRAVRVRAV